MLVFSSPSVCPGVRAELGEVHMVLPEWVLGLLMLSRCPLVLSSSYAGILMGENTYVFVQHRKKQVRKCSILIAKIFLRIILIIQEFLFTQ